MPEVEERKTMLVRLSEDLAAAGWDQPCKLWMVLGEEHDEYLEYVGSFDMEPAHWMMHRAQEGTLRDEIRGLATCYESWTYPDVVADRLQDNTVSMAYKYLVPPDEHPDHGSSRTIVLVTRDGVVMRADRRSTTTETDANIMDEIEPTGNTGDRLVDYMRAVIGINKPPVNPLTSLSIVLAEGDLLKNVLAKATVEGWDQTRIAAEIFKASPPNVQEQLGDSMPTAVREYLDGDDPQQD